MARMSPKVAVTWLAKVDGTLSTCPKDMKNCVCSLDPDFFVEPIKAPEDETMSKIAAALKVLSGFELQTQRQDYLHFTYQSSGLKFIDDIEFSLSKKPALVEVRSASRLGYWDVGANRKRVESLRKIIAELK